MELFFQQTVAITSIKCMCIANLRNGLASLGKNMIYILLKSVKSIKFNKHMSASKLFLVDLKLYVASSSHREKYIRHNKYARERNSEAHWWNNCYLTLIVF